MKNKNKFLLSLCLTGFIGYAQVISTIANDLSGHSTDYFSGDGGPALIADLRDPQGISIDGSGNIYFADRRNQRVRKINNTGIINTIAGNATNIFNITGATLTGGYNGDNIPANTASLNSPYGVCADNAGNVFIADAANNRIRKISAAGVITTVAGNGTAGFGGDGAAAISANLNFPTGIAIDAAGNLLIADQANNRIRKVNATGIINTIAGTGTAGYNGDNIAATSAQINTPHAITVDASQNIYIADQANNRIRKINSAGIITTVAGNGTAGFSGDGFSATSASINAPNSVAVDASTNIYFSVADLTVNNGRIRMVNAAGIINTYAGNGTFIQNSSSPAEGDGGLAINAPLPPVNAVALNPSGTTLYFSEAYIEDYYGDHIRQVSALCPDIATSNDTIPILKCLCGPSTNTVVIGAPALPNMTYAWSPATYLNSTTVAQPTVSIVWTSTGSSLPPCIIYTLTVSSSLCTTVSSTIQVCPKAVHNAGGRLAGIETESSVAGFMVFPNPSEGLFTITLSNRADYIEVTDIMGRLIVELKDISSNQIALDLTPFNKGIYFIRAKVGDAIQKQKIILE